MPKYLRRLAGLAFQACYICIVMAFNMIRGVWRAGFSAVRVSLFLFSFVLRVSIFLDYEHQA